MNEPIQSRAYKAGYSAYIHSKILNSTPTPLKGTWTRTELMEWYEGFNDAVQDDMESCTPSDDEL